MRKIPKLSALACATVVLGLVSAPPEADARYRTLYNFSGGATSDGHNPTGDVVFGPDGALYGTTKLGGNASGCGIVFQLRPPLPDKRRWQYRTIHRFADDEGGCTPIGGLTVGPDGALYGTTHSGGTANRGTVFRLMPIGDADWDHAVLHHFLGDTNDGSAPQTRLLLHSDGALYGVTRNGGTFDFGTVFRLRPPAEEGRRWRASLLHSFAGAPNDGHGQSRGGLTVGPGGDLYGTTTWGGSSDEGTIFKLREARKLVVLRSFDTGDGGHSPAGPLTLGPDGAFYGTAYDGGAHGWGTVFKLRSRRLSVLHTYTGLPDVGSRPYRSLVFAPNGKLYGLNDQHGVDDSSAASIFRMRPNGRGYSVRFTFSFDGPFTVKPNGLALGPDGALYGTTDQGPNQPFGTVFRYEP